jgi:hypothetical protein
LQEANSTFQKHRRRLIKPRNLDTVGEANKGKICYPSSIKSSTQEWLNYHIRGFCVHTRYHSILSGEKKPLLLRFWSFTHVDTLDEYIGISSTDLPLFVKESDVKPIKELDESLLVSKNSNHKCSEPRKIIVPHRKTLDNYGLNITLFQRDNYLGIPICLASRDKKKITEGWVYLYNTVINGVEGLYYEVDCRIPYLIYGERKLI